MSSYRSIRKCL